MDKPIFILGISSRSGTNFLYDLIRLHPAVDMARTVEEDFLLFGAHHLQEYIDEVSKRWDMGWGMAETDSEELFRSLGEAGLKFLERRQRKPGLRLLTKTPEVRNLPLFFRLFPDAKLIIIVRDGRAMVESKINSFDIDFLNAARNWAGAAQKIIEFQKAPPSPEFRVIKYEELYQQTHDCVQMLLDFLELDASAYDFSKIDSLPVRGSSVFRGDSGKLDWKPVQKTDAFKPLERFAHWTPEQHRDFNFLAGNQLENLGYEINETLYIKANLAFTPHDQQSDLVTNLDTGAKVLMPADSVEILKSFDRFLPLRKHFYRSALQDEELPKFLEFSRVCAESGLLQTQDEYLERLRQLESAEPGSESASTAIFIRTCDRPVFLQRILSSLIASDNTRQLPIYVLDDSRAADVQRENAGIVARLGKDRAAPVLYLGEQWQRAFIRQLAQSFPDYEGLIGYLLAPRPAGVFSAGRLLNIAMLAFAGQRLLTFDDDYIPDRAWRHREASSDLLCVTSERAFCLQGYRSEEELLEAGTELPHDPLQSHLELLGAPVATALVKSHGLLPETVTLAGMTSEFASTLGPTSRILTTGNGVMGRPVAPDASHGWFAPPLQTVPVWAGGKDYNAWMAGRHIFASSRHTSIVATSYGMPVGIDNSLMTPPTLPAGKREDTLFVYLLHRLHGSSVHLEFPWAIAHKREERDWRGATVDTPVALCLAQALMVGMDNALQTDDGAGSAEARLMMVGSALSEKSTLSDESLMTSLLAISQNLASAHRLKLMQLLEGAEVTDDSKKADLEKAIRTSKEAQLNRSRLPTMEDAHCPGEEAAQLQWYREELLLFGQSLLIWPMLWDYCRENS